MVDSLAAWRAAGSARAHSVLLEDAEGISRRPSVFLGGAKIGILYGFFMIEQKTYRKLALTFFLFYLCREVCSILRTGQTSRLLERRLRRNPRPSNFATSEP